MRKGLTIGAVASLKRGFEHFVYRELCLLERQGASIAVFPTKHQSGLYNPHENWQYYRWKTWFVLMGQLWYFLKRPRKYSSVLWESWQHGAVKEFFLAAYFSERMNEVDLIYATFGDRKLFVGYFCKRLLQKPLAVMIHAYELYDNPNDRMFLRALQGCDQIITVTEYNREQLRDRFDIPSERVEVVRLSIDLQEYRPREKFVILIVAFFAERKGHRILLEALQKMNRDDVEVWVVGDSGAEMESVDVQGMVREMGLESQVAFFGKLGGTALKALYHACDVFCLPCHFDRTGDGEGFPTVLIEAMACGKPVVTSRHVEIPRIVEQYVVDEFDVDGVANALEELYGSVQLREASGERNRELAEQHFSTRNLQRTAAIFARLVDGDEPPPRPTLSQDQPHTTQNESASFLVE